MTMRDAFGQKLAELGKTHPELVVLDADVSGSTKSSYFGKGFPDRFFNWGVSEGNLAGTAAGLATCGYHLVINAFSIFLALKSADQIRNDMCYNSLPVIIAGAYAGFSDSFDGASHQAICDMAIFRAMPNMQVLSPADNAQAEQALEYALSQKGPVYIRLNRNDVPDLPNNGLLQRENPELTIVSTGIVSTAAVEAAQMLESCGIMADVICTQFVKPLGNEKDIKDSVRRTGRLLAVEEHVISGGFGSAICESLAKEGISFKAGFCGSDDRFGESGPYKDILAKFGLDAKGIVDSARKLLGR